MLRQYSAARIAAAGYRGARRAVRGVLRQQRLHQGAHLSGRPPAVNGRHGAGRAGHITPGLRPIPTLHILVVLLDLEGQQSVCSHPQAYRTVNNSVSAHGIAGSQADVLLHSFLCSF